MGINRDRDTLTDGLDNCPDAANDTQTDTDGDAAGDACDPDDDDDGLLDAVETGSGVFVSAFDAGTDPVVADSDGDGFDDGLEVAAGSDPNDALSVPSGAGVPALPLGGLLVLCAGVVAAAGGRGRRARRSAGGQRRSISLALAFALTAGGGWLVLRASPGPSLRFTAAPPTPVATRVATRGLEATTAVTVARAPVASPSPNLRLMGLETEPSAAQFCDAEHWQSLAAMRVASGELSVDPSRWERLSRAGRQGVMRWASTCRSGGSPVVVRAQASGAVLAHYVPTAGTARSGAASATSGIGTTPPPPPR